MDMQNFEEHSKANERNSPWFHFLREKKGQCAKCKLCKRIIKTHGGSTSGLHTHLKAIHEIDLLKRDVTSTTVIDSSKSVQKTKSSIAITDFFKSDKMDDSLPAILARMTACDGLSFNIICTSYDIRKGLTARGLSNIPKDHKTIQNMVFNYSENIRNQMTKELSYYTANGNKFSITFDEWTSVRNRRYVNINIHSEKEFWNLGLIRAFGTMPAEKCIELVNERLGDFGLSLKNIVAITTDGAAVMTKVGRLIEAHQQLCFAHAIQLAVISVIYKQPINEVIEKEANVTSVNSSRFEEDENCTSDDDELSDEDYENENGLLIISTENDDENTSFLAHHEMLPLIKKIRKVVQIFRASPTKNDKILQKYVKEEFGKELSLVLDSRTRWNSLVSMIERFLKLKNCIKKSLIDLKSPIMFSDAEFEIMSDILSVLLPIKLTVEAICRQDATLLSADAAIQFMIKSITDHPCSLSYELNAALKKRILQRRTEISSVLQYLHNPNSNENQSDDEDKDYELFPNITKASIAKIIHLQIQRLALDNEHDEPVASTSANVSNSNIIFDVDDYDEDDQRNEVSLTLQEKLQRAIYKKTSIRLPESGIDKNKNDLIRSIKKEMSFFETNGIRGKYLTLVYNYFLTIQPTSVESERAFSAAGLICTRIRSRLGDKSLNKLCFLRSYFNKLKKKL